MTLTTILIEIHAVLFIVFLLRIALREDLQSDARMAWVFTILLMPVAGLVLYFLFGSARIAGRTRRKHQDIFNGVKARFLSVVGADYLGDIENIKRDISTPYRAPFHYIASIHGFYPVMGNRGELMRDGSTARARILEDIHSARYQVSVLYYIWLPDKTGLDMARALIVAAKRGVKVRVAVDHLGSKSLIKHVIWQEMQDAGIQARIVMPLRWYTPLFRRIDLRNHRKITLIDGKTLYCGSQNCADEAFAIKAKYAPWVDILVRFQGPIVTQMQLLFASDWVTNDGGKTSLFDNKADCYEGGFAAQVLGDGPTERANSTSQFLVTLLNAAQHEVVITTPYFVPDVPVLNALCAAAYRGVVVSMVFPARNDSWIVRAVSRSHYYQLLCAGIRVYEYEKGLLHAKTITVDGRLSFIGSTNLDMRSFDLNFENNILFEDVSLTTDIIQRQREYIVDSRIVALEETRHYPLKRIWHNLLATVGPIL